MRIRGNHTRLFLTSLALLVGFGLQTGPAALAQNGAERESEAWPGLKSEYFGEREIFSGEGVVSLDAPDRAEDAAVVPIAIHDRLADDDDRRIEKLWLFIDNNPVPMSAEFEFGPGAPNADIATRVRVNAYTHMRAVAETSDGKLYMDTRYVKASGGCSAPASKDPDAAKHNLGQIRLRQITQDGEAEAADRVQMLVRHPNHTGLQMNQLTRHTIPAHYVNAIDIAEGDERILHAEMTFSLSENPSLRFSRSPAAADGPLRVRIHDTEDNTFTANLDDDAG